MAAYLQSKDGSQQHYDNSVTSRKNAQGLNLVFPGINTNDRSGHRPRGRYSNRKVYSDGENVCSCGSTGFTARLAIIFVLNMVYRAPNDEPSKNMALSSHTCSFPISPTIPRPMMACMRA